MKQNKQAAIDLDQIRSKPLNEVNAADFLAALEQSNVNVQQLVGIPEKKKVEFWAEPEVPLDPKVGDLIDWLKLEKKKVELEIPPDMTQWREMREAHYNELVARVALDVEAKLRP